MGGRKRLEGGRNPDRAVALALEALEPRLAPAFSILADLNPNVFSIATPSAGSCVAGGTLYFTRTDIATGTELWKTDGTQAGTVIVRDINPGAAGSSPGGMVAIGPLVYFRADNGAFGAELWRTDGTRAGTVMVRDINPGPAGSDPAGLADLGGTLLFAADDGVRGCELWKINPATGSPALVRDVLPGPRGGLASLGGTFLAVAGARAFFAADDGASGLELWKTDGTAPGTALVRDIFPGSGTDGPNGSYPASLTPLGGTLLFTADNGATGTELWRSDGTAAGTTLVRDILPGADSQGPKSSFPLDIVPVGSWASFTADNGANGRELWRTDGTTAGTALLREIRPGATGAFSDYAPGQFAASGGTLFFAADNGANGMELWKSTGTLAGTVLVKDIRPGASAPGAGRSSFPSGLSVAGGRVYFTADDGVGGVELWSSDGTLAGTALARDLAAGSASSEIFPVGALAGALLFTAGDGDLHRSQGTGALTTLVSENAGTQGQGSNPGPPVEAGGALLFRAVDSNYFPALWKAGAPGAAPAQAASGFRYPGPANLVNQGGTLFFAASNGATGVELWRRDSATGKAALVRDIAPGFAGSAPAGIAGADGVVWFSADDGVSGRELWRSDGTEAGTALVRNIAQGLDAANRPASSAPADLVLGGGLAWFTADNGVSGRELWRSDGTAAGTHMVRDIFPGATGSDPGRLAWGGGFLWFAADNGAGGRELWRSDGTAAGTLMVRDIFPGPAGSGPEGFAWADGRLWFTADDGGFGRELWRSDGTAAGTGLVRDIFPGPGGAAPEGAVWGGGFLWFAADDGVSGRELWKSDGTAAGTALVRDIAPGAPGSVEPGGALLAWAGDMVCLAADDGMTGLELWKSDGTAAGTGLAGEVVPGERGGGIAWLAAFGNRVVFSADDGLRGREPWSFSPNAPPVDLRLSAYSIMENLPAGTVVGTLSAQDPDPGDTFAYALASGPLDAGNRLFSIQGNELRTATVFDHEAGATHTIRVRVTDAGGLTLEKALTIAVADADEGPVVASVAAAGVIANVASAISGVRVVDPWAGSARLATTLSVPAGRLTLGTRAGLVFQVCDGVLDATMRFTGTLAQTNAALKALSYITATDALAPVSIGVTVQRGAFTSGGAVAVVPAEGRMARGQDPSLARKVSLVVQGTATADTIVVRPVGTSNTSYTVALNGGVATVTGITGRLVVFGLGGNDTIDMSAARLAARVDGGEGNDVVLGGQAADMLLGGAGADLVAGGLGADTLSGGLGDDMVVDGSVAVTTPGRSFRSVLDGWAASGDFGAVTGALLFISDKKNRDTLRGEGGVDWFWSATSGAVADITDLVAGERRRTA